MITKVTGTVNVSNYIYIYKISYELVACRVISKLTIKHVHTIPVTFKVILLRNPPNGESQEKVALCHEDNTVTLTMYVWLLGHSIDEKLPQPLAHLPNSTIQPICPGKSK